MADRSTVVGVIDEFGIAVDFATEAKQDDIITAINNMSYSSPLTTKGDLITHDGAGDVRLAVGPDGYVPTADSGSATGITWKEAGSGSGASGVTEFTGLTDTPSAYTGQAGKVATVNTAETALEFTDKTTMPSRIGFAAKFCNTTIRASTWTRLSFDSEIEDTNNAWNGSSFTVPEDGIYEIFGHGTFLVVSDGNRAVVVVYVNGSNTAMLGRGAGSGDNPNGFGAAVRLELSQGDILDMRAWCANATEMWKPVGPAYNTFSAYKMN